MIVDDLALIVKIADRTPYGTTGLDNNNRNKVIQREMNMYKASLVAKTGNKLHGAMVDEILKTIERGNLDGNYWDEVPDDRDPSGTFEQGIDFDPTDEVSQEQIEPTSVDRKDASKAINQMEEFMKESMTSPDEFYPREPDYEKPNVPIELKDGVSKYDLSKIDVGTNIPIISSSNKQKAIHTSENITVKDSEGNDIILKVGDIIKGRNYNFVVSDEAMNSGMSSTLNFIQQTASKSNPKLVLLNEIEKKIKILNEKERATSNKGKELRIEQIPILKAEIEEMILELQGE
tara:strand:- start:139 stop:1008 length:870 start_codon:yes stop_codon:yes gene_type:complete